MAKGVGGSDEKSVLESLALQVNPELEIQADEYQQRIRKAQAIMQQMNIDGLFVNAGTNLQYFTGSQWFASERLVGAFIPSRGDIQYIVPHFEIGSFQLAMGLSGQILSWQEHENPYSLFVHRLHQFEAKQNKSTFRLAVCESTPFFVANHFQQKMAQLFGDSTLEVIDGKVVTAHCRMRKSETEIKLIQQAMSITLEVHKAAAKILRKGITTKEVEAFINQAHLKLAGVPSYFCIVLFGEATQYPHGVKHVQTLQEGDVVLIDTGCRLNGYISDITRTYVFGDASEKHRQVWQAEKQAQAAAFAAAQLGKPCEQVDQAARASLGQSGFSTGYDLPGLPHRTGHGIGMDIHEWPYLVGGDTTPLDIGMCFSNEPMICVDGAQGFGVRLEDHFYMSEEGPKWFTQPSKSIDEPFAE